MRFEIKAKIDSWKTHRNLTYDLLQSLSEKTLKKTVGKNMGSIGKQFRHMGDIQFCYIEAITTGKIDFSKVLRDYSIEHSTIKLRQFLEDMDDKLYRLLETNSNKEINWGFTKIPLTQHLNFMIQHEILHHGELIVYIRTLSLPFPRSWEEIWGPLNVNPIRHKTDKKV